MKIPGLCDIILWKHGTNQPVHLSNSREEMRVIPQWGNVSRASLPPTQRGGTLPGEDVVTQTQLAGGVLFLAFLPLRDDVSHFPELVIRFL